MEKNKIEVWTDEQGAVFSADKKKLLHCPDVEEYVIPDHADCISPDAFDTAPRLRRIDFNKVLSIPEKIVGHTYEVPDFHGSSWTGDFDTVTRFYIYSIFENCPLVEDIKLSCEMIHIGRYVFAGLQHLKSFTIPYAKYGGFHIKALWGCNQLKELTVNDNFTCGDYSQALGDSSEIYYKTNRHWSVACELPALETCRIKLLKGWDKQDWIDAVCGCASFKHVKTIILPTDILKQIEDDLPKKDIIEYIGE